MPQLRKDTVQRACDMRALCVHQACTAAAQQIDLLMRGTEKAFLTLLRLGTMAREVIVRYGLFATGIRVRFSAFRWPELFC